MYDYMENEDFQMVSLPYTSKKKNTDYSFVILLPRKRYGLFVLKLEGVVWNKRGSKNCNTHKFDNNTFQKHVTQCYS